MQIYNITYTIPSNIRSRSFQKPGAGCDKGQQLRQWSIWLGVRPRPRSHLGTLRTQWQIASGAFQSGRVESG